MHMIMIIMWSTGYQVQPRPASKEAPAEVGWA